MKNKELRTKNSRAAAPNFNCRFAALLHQKSFISHEVASYFSFPNFNFLLLPPPAAPHLNFNCRSAANFNFSSTFGGRNL
jgi:hypothetical protein